MSARSAREDTALQNLAAWDGLARLDSILNQVRSRPNFFLTVPRILRVEGVHSDMLGWLAKAVAAIEGIRTVITGHSPLRPVPGVQGMLEVLTWDDLREYADFNRDFLSAVREAFEGGKSVDEAVTTLSLPAKYADYDLDRARANVQIIYDELGTRAHAGKRLDAAVARNAGRRSLLKRTEF